MDPLNINFDEEKIKNQYKSFLQKQVLLKNNKSRSLNIGSQNTI